MALLTLTPHLQVPSTKVKTVQYLFFIIKRYIKMFVKRPWICYFAEFMFVPSADECLVYPQCFNVRLLISLS